MPSINLYSAPKLLPSLKNLKKNQGKFENCIPAIVWVYHSNRAVARRKIGVSLEIISVKLFIKKDKNCIS